MPTQTAQPIIIVRRRKGEGGRPHGGAWKVAYADFVTAMLALFIKSSIDLAQPANSNTVIFGIGTSLVIGLGALLIGVVLMIFARCGLPRFFTRRPEVATLAAE